MSSPKLDKKILDACRPLTRDELRAWRAAAIERTQAAWRNR